jgi:hypothetical protein
VTGRILRDNWEIPGWMAARGGVLAVKVNALRCRENVGAGVAVAAHRTAPAQKHEMACIGSATGLSGERVRQIAERQTPKK